MSYEDLMARIAREIPELAGKLSAPRVTYVKSSRKTYISFNSSVLAGEKQFLKLEAILREMFPGRPLALRIASPDLKAGFLEDPSSYREVLDDFLRRNYPMARGWIGRIGWQMERNQLTDTPGLAGEENGDGLLTLVFPDEISLQVMRQSDVGIRLATAVYDIFTAKIRVEMTVEGTREERLRRMKEERRDAALTVTAREMAEWYGTGVSIAKEEESAARKPEREKKPAKPRKEQAGKEKGAAAEAPASPVGKPIMGRSIADRPVEIRELTGESGLVVVQGEIFHLEQKELKGGETLLVTFAVTDGTSSVLCKIFFRYRSRFMKKEEAEATPITDEERAAVKEKTDRIKDGMCVRVRGECLYDSYARDLCISVRDMVETEKEERVDTAEEKRVELAVAGDDGVPVVAGYVAEEHRLALEEHEPLRRDVPDEKIADRVEGVCVGASFPERALGVFPEHHLVVLPPRNEIVGPCAGAVRPDDAEVAHREKPREDVRARMKLDLHRARVRDPDALDVLDRPRAGRGPFRIGEVFEDRRDILRRHRRAGDEAEGIPEPVGARLRHLARPGSEAVRPRGVVDREDGLVHELHGASLVRRLRLDGVDHVDPLHRTDECPLFRRRD